MKKINNLTNLLDRKGKVELMVRYKKPVLLCVTEQQSLL